MPFDYIRDPRSAARCGHEAMPMHSDNSYHDGWMPRSPPPTSVPRRPRRRADEPQRRDGERSDVRIVRRFPFSDETVFAAWIDPTIASQWLFATATRPMTRATIDARAGGSFCLVEARAQRSVEHRGAYVHFVPPGRLAFMLKTPEHATATGVDVVIEPRGRGCVLILVHADVHPDRVTYVRRRWTGMLYGLGATLCANASSPPIIAAQNRRAE